MTDLFGVRFDPGSAIPGPTFPAADVGTELMQVREIFRRFDSAACQVRVLGPLSIRTFNGPVEDGIRPGALKLAALLALYHVRGRTIAELGVLWPDAAGAKVPNLRKNDLMSLRRDGLKRDILAGNGPRDGYAAEFVPYRFGRYRLDPRCVGVDLACFQQLRDLATRTCHARVRVAAAEAALSLCGGEPLEGIQEAWAVVPRTVLRRDVETVRTLLS